VTKQLDLLDIQGNILRAYGRFGYPVARYVFLNVRNAAKGREFVGEITKKSDDIRGMGGWAGQN